MTATSSRDAERTLDAIAPRDTVKIVGVDGDDELGHRLAAVGLWPGAVIQRIATAPLGDPMLYRVHGYRLALRRSEARRVRVAECTE